MQHATPKTHMRAYMTAVGSEPSRTQAPPLEGEWEPHSPAENPHLGVETLHHCQADLGDLADQEMYQLIEDLTWEVTLGELNAPPRSPPPMPLGNPAGSGDPDMDDQEVTFLRGKGGFPWDNHSNILLPHSQMEDGLHRDHLLNP